MLIYRLILSLILPALVWRTRIDWVVRWKGPVLDQPRVWLHGASVGELTAARPLIAAMDSLPLLVTCNTATALAMVKGWDLPHVAAALAPYDRTAPARRIMKQCRGLIILENELWPNRIAAAHHAGVPVIWLGARMSDRSARVWGRWAGLARRLLAPVRLVIPQDAGSAANLIGLGVDKGALRPPAQLKAAYVPARWDGHPAFDPSRTVLAASTHADEDLMVLRAFAAARAKSPEMRLIIAPRHPDRAEAITAEIAALSLTSTRHSLGEAPTAPVHVADTLGEMDLWYASAGLCFVGGSLVDRGGHTPFEPTAHGVPIVHGPSVRNFAESYAALDAADAAVRVDTEAELAEAVLTHLGDADLAARATRVFAPADLSAISAEVMAHLAPPGASHHS